MASVDLCSRTDRSEQSEPSEALAAGALLLARRFVSGATMWCVAPRWPAHGSHVAVEFVHPVIVGKRALPAMHVEAADATGELRLLARPGDVLLVVSSADDARVLDLMQRGEAWGMSRIWLGAGTRPPPGSADQIVWLDQVDGDLPAYSGDMVLLYHLLWELTHVVFEHPGLLEADPYSDDEVCITCSDEGRVAEVRIVHDEASVEVVSGGRAEMIDVSLLETVQPGDLVLVHAGVALVTLTSFASGS
jgi:hydrogenase maturation factor